MKLKKLDLPSSSLDLKNFLSYCLLFTDYENYANFYTNQIKERKNDLEEYSIKIIREHFLKSESEWENILNKKDFKNLLKTKITEFKHKDFDLLNNETIDENKLCYKEQYYLRDNLTNDFYNISEYLEHSNYRYEKDEKYNLENNWLKNHIKINNNQLFFKINYMSHYHKAPFRNRDGSYRQNEHNFIINLIDGSITYEDKTRSVKIPSEIPHNRFG